MKTIFLTFTIVLMCIATGIAQNVGINSDGSTPDASAGLDIKYATKGVLIPRVDITDLSSPSPVTSPAISLIVYNTNTNTGTGFFYWDGNKWVKLSDTNNVDSWLLTGNTGTIPGTHFLGTIDNQSLDFRTNNMIHARITTKGQIEILNTGRSVYIGEGTGASDDQNNNYNNVGIGYQVLYSNVIGDANTASGYQALYSNTTGYRNIANGYQALYFNNGSQNTASGYQALYNNTNGNVNTATGNFALYSNTIGSQNTANGDKSLFYNTSGHDNTAVGHRSLYKNITGFSNVAIGTRSLYENTNSSNLVAIGDSSMYNNTTGQYNTAIGSKTLFSNTTGKYNTGIGTKANQYNEEGNNNTIIGYEAGRGSTLHNKSGSVFLGYQAGYYETNSNRLYIENSNITTPLIYGEFDNDLVRINGTLDINNAFLFPTTDGTNGQILKTDGSGILTWSDDAGGATQLNELSDVNSSTPTEKNVLVADGTDWESRPLTEADISDFGTYLKNGDNVSELNNDAGYLTSFTESDPVWTAAEPSYGNLTEAEEITGNWVNTANPWSTDEIVSTVMVEGENVSLLNNDAGYLTSFTESDPVWTAAEPDYGNLTEAEEITGNWVNTTNPWSTDEIVSTVMVEGENVSLLNNDAGYLTSFTESDPVWTAAEPDYGNLT